VVQNAVLPTTLVARIMVIAAKPIHKNVAARHAVIAMIFVVTRSIMVNAARTLTHNVVAGVVVYPQTFVVLTVDAIHQVHKFAVRDAVFPVKLVALNKTRCGLIAARPTKLVVVRLHVVRPTKFVILMHMMEKASAVPLNAQLLVRNVVVGLIPRVAVIFGSARRVSSVAA
jgi:hypothetical protein